MSNSIIPIQNQNVVSSEEWGREKLELLKRTICKESSDDEFKLFLHVAKRSGLDPFARQIHSVRRWSEKNNRYEMTIQVGIDGFRLIADRTGKYAGSDDPVVDSDKSPTKATVTVYKMVDGVRCPFTATARWDEYYPGDKQGFMWKKMPCVMVGKCAEALALRKAFPAELSGLYTNEEMAQADRGGVYPEQPGLEDGVQTPSVYKFNFGQYKGKTVEEVYHDPHAKCGPQGLKSYIQFLDKQEKLKPLSPAAIEARKHIEDFLGAVENAPTEREPGWEG